MLNISIESAEYMPQQEINYLLNPEIQELMSQASLQLYKADIKCKLTEKHFTTIAVSKDCLDKWAMKSHGCPLEGVRLIDDIKGILDPIRYIPNNRMQTRLEYFFYDYQAVKDSKGIEYIVFYDKMLKEFIEGLSNVWGHPYILNEHTELSANIIQIVKDCERIVKGEYNSPFTLNIKNCAFRLWEYYLTHATQFTTGTNLILEGIPSIPTDAPTEGFTSAEWLVDEHIRKSIPFEDMKVLGDSAYKKLQDKVDELYLLLSEYRKEVIEKLNPHRNIIQAQEGHLLNSLKDIQKTITRFYVDGKFVLFAKAEKDIAEAITKYKNPFQEYYKERDSAGAETGRIYSTCYNDRWTGPLIAPNEKGMHPEITVFSFSPAEIAELRRWGLEKTEKVLKLYRQIEKEFKKGIDKRRDLEKRNENYLEIISLETQRPAGLTPAPGFVHEVIGHLFTSAPILYPHEDFFSGDFQTAYELTYKNQKDMEKNNYRIVIPTQPTDEDPNFFIELTQKMGDQFQIDPKYACSQGLKTILGMYHLYDEEAKKTYNLTPPPGMTVEVAGSKLAGIISPYMRISRANAKGREEMANFIRQVMRYLQAIEIYNIKDNNPRIGTQRINGLIKLHGDRDNMTMVTFGLNAHIHRMMYGEASQKLFALHQTDKLMDRNAQKESIQIAAQVVIEQLIRVCFRRHKGAVLTQNGEPHTLLSYMHKTGHAQLEEFKKNKNRLISRYKDSLKSLEQDGTFKEVIIEPSKEGLEKQRVYIKANDAMVSQYQSLMQVDEAKINLKKNEKKLGKNKVDA